MTPIKTLLTIICLTAITVANAQEDNPFESIGKKGKIITASNGRYIETFDYDSVQRIGSILFNIRTNKIVKLLNPDQTFQTFSDNSSASRWLSIDPLAGSKKNISYSPYSFVKNDPILLVDPDGRDWFDYQAKGEKNKSWHYQEGHKATYTNGKGKEVTTSRGYGYLVTYKMTGKNSEGATTGVITVYNQNKAVLTVNNAMTGNDNFSGTGSIPTGNYMMNLSKRDADGPNKIKPDGSNPEPYDGIQKIPNNATFEWDGHKYPMNPTITSAYGNGRVRLNQTDEDDNPVPMSEQSAGYYLHGKMDAHNWTHGCVCDKSESVFNYFWSGEGKDVRGYVPFAVSN